MRFDHAEPYVGSMSNREEAIEEVETLVIGAGPVSSHILGVRPY